MYLVTSLAPLCIHEQPVSMAMPETMLAIKTKPGVIRLITINDIIAAKAAGNYVEIVLSKEVLLHRSTLKALADRLPANFVQLHRSYVINLHHLTEVRSDLERYSDCHMSNDEVVPLSAQFRASVLSLIGVRPDDTSHSQNS